MNTVYPLFTSCAPLPLPKRRSWRYYHTIALPNGERGFVDGGRACCQRCICSCGSSGDTRFFTVEASRAALALLRGNRCFFDGRLGLIFLRLDLRSMYLQRFLLVNKAFYHGSKIGIARSPGW